MRPLLLALLLPLAASPALAGDPGLPRPGGTGTVRALTNPDETYTLSLPRSYRPGRPSPIIYLFSPDASIGTYISLYKSLLGKRGFILCGSNTAKNGIDVGPAIEAMHRDTEMRLTLHGKRRYGSGFSGGARMSSAMAMNLPERFAGLILFGAGLGGGARPRDDVPIAMIVGNSDFNQPEFESLKATYAKIDVPSLFLEFTGGHAIPPMAKIEEAVEWHEKVWNETYEGDGEAAAAARRAVVTRRVAIAKKLEDEGKPAHALLECRSIAEGLPGWEGVEEVEAKVKELSKTDLAKSEEKARKKLLSVLYREGKLSDSRRKGCIPAYEKIAEAFPGTPSADLAKERVERLR